MIMIIWPPAAGDQVSRRAGWQHARSYPERNEAHLRLPQEEIPGTELSQSNSFHARCRQSLQAPTGDSPRALLSTEGTLVTVCKPRGADVMFKNVSTEGWLTHWLGSFGRRCWEGSSVSLDCKSMRWPSVSRVSLQTEMVKYENWYFCDKLNGVELHQAGSNCFILSCSKISRQIPYLAALTWEDLTAFCSDIT